MGEFRNIRRLGLPGGPNEVIADQMGQWSNPGQPTRIEGNEITMQGVPYPVWALPNVGVPTLMHPDQDYSFPGAEYVDELPLAQMNLNLDGADPSWQMYHNTGESPQKPITKEDIASSQFHTPYQRGERSMQDLISAGYRSPEYERIQRENQIKKDKTTPSLEIKDPLAFYEANKNTTAVPGSQGYANSTYKQKKSCPSNISSPTSFIHPPPTVDPKSNNFPTAPVKISGI